VVARPTQADIDYHAQLQGELDAFLRSDPLLREVSVPSSDPLKTLQLIRERLAHQAVILDFRRREDDKYGGFDSPQIVSKLITCLKELAALESRIQEIRVSKDMQVIDLHSESMQKLFQIFVQHIRTAAEAVLPPELKDLFFNKLETEFKDWEENTENALR